MIAAGPIDILRFLAGKAADGTRCAMVTLVGVEGSSSRSVGTQMAVSRDGGFAGSFSGGCIEAAVVAEAVGAIENGAGRTVRFGSGSPYIDVRLPCGGGIDLLFTPVLDGAPIRAVLGMLERRLPALIGFGESGLEAAGAHEPAGWRDGFFRVPYVPELRIVAVGQGEDLLAFARLAHRFGAQTAVLTPDRSVAEMLRDEAIAAELLHSREVLIPFASDAWTALVFLFHDRDWEEGLLPQALRLPAFYHGAVGSPGTHRARLAMLRQAGVAESEIARLRGSIGLIPSTRDPATLALSILAEIVEAYNAVAAVQS